MKIKYIISSLLLLLSLCSFSQDEDHWEVYLAQYEKGAGSTLVNMSLKELAPIQTYPFLLKAGVRLAKCTPEGLPTKEEWDALHSISDKIKSTIEGLKQNKSAGTFSYQCSRMDYYYIKDTGNIRRYLEEAFKTNFPKYEYVIEIKNDPNWEAYLTFLYPNEETREYIGNEKVVLSLSKAGDDLSKPRQVDHWLYFKTEGDRESFLRYALQEKFKLEEKGIADKSALHFKLHLSRTDKVDIASISAVTIALRRKAKECNGEYDGWETFVIK
jgi:hypothetical protein